MRANCLFLQLLKTCATFVPLCERGRESIPAGLVLSFHRPKFRCAADNRVGWCATPNGVRRQILEIMSKIVLA